MTRVNVPRSLYPLSVVDPVRTALEQWRMERRMPAHVLSAALVGIEAALVRVEVDVAGGLPTFTTVGLPDSAIRESRERVRSAIKNAGYDFPQERITVNLSPADVRKEGTSFDLPIALGILAATGPLTRVGAGRVAVVGELALDGQIQPVRGALSVGLACRRRGVSTLLVPCDNAAEAAVVGGLRIIGAATLRDAVMLLNGEIPPPPTPRTISTSPTSAVRRMPSARWRSPPRAGTTSCWSGPRAPGRRCWRGAWRHSCPRSAGRSSWRWGRSGRSPGCSRAAAG
jgi:hypothetical protein